MIFKRHGVAIPRQTLCEWALGAAELPAVVFEFTQSRESAWPLLSLSQYRGYLQAGAYGGFDARRRGVRIIEMGCFAHARRKLFEVAQAHKSLGLAHEAPGFIAKLY